MKDNRYQHQRWWVKLWRRRWYLVIPYWYLRYCRCKWDDGMGNTERITFDEAWGIAVGEAQIEMQWSSTLDEVLDRLELKGGELEMDQEDTD